MLQLIIRNHDTFALGQLGQARRIIDHVTSYVPADVAAARATGWAPPEQHVEGLAVDRIRFSRPAPQGMRFPSGLARRVIAALRWHGFPLEVIDERVRPDPGVPDVPAIPLRRYQRLAVEAALVAGEGVIDAPPRAGKTRMLTEVLRRLSLPALWIAPTKSIVGQTARAIEALCGRNYAREIVGAKTWETARNTPVVVCTYATAAALPQAFFDTRQVLACDEFHHAASMQVHGVFAKARHIFHRFGMTGTFMRSRGDDLAMHALLAETVFRVTSTELLEQGFLVPMHMVAVPVDGERLPAGVSWEKGELPKLGLAEHTERNALVLGATCELAARGMQTIVLVSRKQQGHHLRAELAQRFGQARVAFVSTDTPSSICDDHVQSFARRDGIRILIGTSMIGEGTDIPTADALVYAMGHAAEVGHRQALFRVATASEGKRCAYLVDFTDRHHRLLANHADARWRTYVSEPCIVSRNVLAAPSDFRSWLDHFSVA